MRFLAPFIALTLYTAAPALACANENEGCVNIGNRKCECGGGGHLVSQGATSHNPYRRPLSHSMVGMSIGHIHRWSE
jgi:hypothetical protein